MKLEPDNPSYRVSLAFGYHYLGRFEEANKELETAVRLGMGTRGRNVLLMCLAVLGKEDEARKLLYEIDVDRKTQYYGPTNLAVAYSALGGKDKAFELLEEGIAESRASFLFSHDEPWFDSLRADPRFVSLVGRLNLPSRS